MAQLSKNIKKSMNAVKIANELVEAFVKKNNLSALKLLFYIAKSDVDIEKKRLQTLSLKVKEFCKYANVDMKTLKRNLIQMQETSISIKDEKKESYISILPRVDFTYGDVMYIDIYQEVLDLIKDIKNKYTFIDVERLMKLRSKHSLRMLLLLERISQYSDNVGKRKTVSLEELNMMFGTKYKRIQDFDRYVLENTKEELDRESEISFIYQVNYDKEQNTVGRARAVSITLDVIKNKTPNLL